MPTRRNALKSILAGAAALTTAPANALHKMTDFMPEKEQAIVRKGNIRHSVCRWCYGGFSLEELCVYAKQIGITAIDLIGPSEWDILKKHGLDSSMCNGAEINLVDGWNHREFHEKLVKNYSEMIPKVAKAGYKNLICFSGNRRGMDDETGLKNCVEGLQKIMPLAEKNGVTICIEVFNSKVDHKDYMADNTPWTVELCKRLGSENFKILWDIYHMQINEGDVIRSIRDHHTYFGHYHTAGVPGRNEIDDTQELYYPAIMRAILETGYKGYVAQEFIPKAANPLASLAAAIDICDV
jgi:hydroxypyruvate isomerase